MGSNKKSLKTLKTLRKQIDVVDDKILKALASRLKVVKRIGRVKQKLEMPIIQKNRWADVMRSRLQKAAKIGLSPNLVNHVYKLIHCEAIKIQKYEKITKQKNKI